MDTTRTVNEQQPPLYCLVCGKQAVYNFYGALACDSCRTFFRRYLTQKKPTRCVNLDDKCEIGSSNRRECAKCRFLKCVDVGMRPQLVASVPTMFSSAASSRSLTFKETSSAPKPAVDERQLEQTRLADKSRLLALFEGGKKVTPIDPRLKIKISILRSVIPTIDLIVLDMTDVERDKLLELFNMSFSLTLVTVEDTAQLVGDPQKDIYTVAFASITRTARVLKTLTQVQMLIETDQEILLRESASEIMFLRSIPHLDFENMVWTVYQNPVTKEKERNAPRLPATMLKCVSDEVYNQYLAMVSGLFPEVREDYIISVIVTAIIFYDPNRTGLCDKENINKEQDIFYNILVKYCVLKFGVQGLKKKLEGLTMRERVDKRYLVYLRRMKIMFEQTVIMADSRKILQAVTNQFAIDTMKHTHTQA